MQIEDERRWLLLEGMPHPLDQELFKTERFDHIVQFYTATQRGSQRFRKAVGTNGNHYTQTIKSPKDYSAGAEWEVDTQQWVYELMLRSSIGSVEKGRTTILVDGDIYELDEFMGNCTGLVIVERELRVPAGTEASLAEAMYSSYRNARLPDIFGDNQEITGDNSYSNHNLALDGIPAITYDH